MKRAAMKYCFVIFFLLFTNTMFAQKDTVNKFTFSGYGEFYYSYDFSNPDNHEKPGFIFNHKRHNELNVNLAILKANYTDKKYRANFGLMAGNYAQYNLSAEPTWAQFVNEINAGIKLSNKNNIWLDAGVFPSHIGFESAVSADCWTLTRSLLAENSPYFETGVKLTYTSKNEKFLTSVLYLNGWQRIRKPDYIQQPSFGSQFLFKPCEKLLLNYSNFIGTDKPDSLHALRHFHNFYVQYEPNKKFGILAGLDLGFERDLQKKFSNWYAPVIMIKQKINKKTAIALRGEFYKDKKELIIKTGTANGLRISGFSTNIDYRINDKLMLRVEGKRYHAKDKLFANNSSTKNFSLTTNLTLRL